MTTNAASDRVAAVRAADPSFWRGRRVLVTGATGLIGTALADDLTARGAEVIGTTRTVAPVAGRGMRLATLDPTDLAACRSLLAAERIETVFALAGQSVADRGVSDPVATFAANAGGAWTLLEACRQTPGVAGVVVASSVEVYQGLAGEALAEDAALHVTSPYGVSKRCGELVAQAYHASFGLPVAVARLGNTYGPHDRQVSRLVPGAVASLARGEPPVINGDGLARYTFLFVADAVAGLRAIAERVADPAVAGQIFNLAGDRLYSVREVADAVLAAAGRADVTPTVLGRPSAARPVQAYSLARATTVLGWTPEVALAEGLRRTLVGEGVVGSPARAPRVFIGIPTMNRPDLVMETIASVRAQTLADFTVVVSDNCSDDGVGADVARAVARLDDPRIAFVAQPVNGGEYGQGRYLFAAALAAKAEYFMILHDDDLIEPDYLARAVAALDAAADAALFVANPILIDRCGAASADETRAYRRDHGRDGAREGLFPVLDRHLASGFTPMSATLFRTAAVAAAGLTDDDCSGNYPFECNVMLRLGDRQAQGWFTPEALLRVRYHAESLRNYLNLMDNPRVVGTMLKLFERRRYTGAAERRRRVILARLHRADAAIRLRCGDLAGCRHALRRARALNPRSPRTYLALAGAWLVPHLVRDRLPDLSTRASPHLAPDLKRKATAG